jgi:uncharacterized protein (DUF924 family)
MDGIARQLLDEWFGDTRRDPALASQRNAFWFGADRQRDARLRQSFGESVEDALAGGFTGWQDEPASRLALIILLDQLTRNIHRGTPRAFAGDPRAAALCLAGIGTGMERALAPVEQAFFYMPLQHTEDRAAQEMSVQQFRSLAERNPEHRRVFDHFLEFAEEHRNVIERYGRFPHRNAILGRESTTEEVAYLEQGAPRYGQG